MHFDDQRAKELSALGNHLTLIEGSRTLEQIVERTARAFDTVNELQGHGLISRRKLVYWGEEFNAASNERLTAV